MSPFTRLTAIACPLPIANIDTDQLLPARFMSRTRQEGYGGQLLHDQRFDEIGHPRPYHPLNTPERGSAKILVARRNFGGGSSREGAVYALVDYGIACVVAPSFGDIFASNAVNNGLLPARLSEAETEALLATLAGGEGVATIDLEARRISAGPFEAEFAIDPVWRNKLLNGWDDIDLTASHGDAIAAFAARDAEARPWMQPTG